MATGRLTEVQTVLLGAAGGGTESARHLLELDHECARIARLVHEPLIRQIRLAWWRDAFVAPALLPEHRTDLVVALRSLPRFEDVRPHVIALVDGWEALIADDDADLAGMLDDYARGRGGGLFAAFAPDQPGEAELAGRLWALWDLAGHVDDKPLAEATLAAAAEIREEARKAARSLPRMLAMMATVASGDVARGRGAPRALTPGLYGRLLRAQFFGI